jgi:YfiH family protein
MLVEPPNIKSQSIKAFFTNKILNNDHVHINEALAEKINIPGDNIYLPVQRHTDKIYILESGLKPVVADAVITAEKQILIGILVADCIPVLLYDRDRDVVGAVHAGWRGTAKGILKNTIEIMQAKFKCSSTDIFVAAGPGIRQCCYEVGEDVLTAVRELTGEGNYYSRQGYKYFVDLSSANKIQALSMGIPPENIWQSGECTFCNPEKYYSYRFSKGSAGRQGGFIGMW